MWKRFDAWTWVVLGLMAIDIWRAFAGGKYDLIILLALVAVVVLLFKYPPKRFAKKHVPYGYRPRSSGLKPPQRLQTKPKRKHYPFRVIEGRKRDKSDNDDRKLLH